jgi:hypothetical protein
MKKTPQQKTRRLNLNRETIKTLNDPKLLALARGQAADNQGAPESTSQDDSFVRC